MSLEYRLNRIEAATRSSIHVRAIVLRQPGETDEEARNRAGAPPLALVAQDAQQAYMLMLQGGDIYPLTPPGPALPTGATPREAYAALTGA